MLKYSSQHERHFFKVVVFFPAEPFKTWSDVIGVGRDINDNMQQIIFD